jgi:hypothetical protein
MLSMGDALQLSHSMLHDVFVFVRSCRCVADRLAGGTGRLLRKEVSGWETFSACCLGPGSFAVLPVEPFRGLGQPRGLRVFAVRLLVCCGRRSSAASR